VLRDGKEVKIKWKIQWIEILTSLVMTNHKGVTGHKEKSVRGKRIKFFFYIITNN